MFTRRAVLVAADGGPEDESDDDDDDSEADAGTVAAAAVDCAGDAVEEQAAVSADERMDRSARLHCARKHGPPARLIPAKFGDRHRHARSC